MNGGFDTSVLAPFDEDALSLLASKGLVRRAAKETVVAEGEAFRVGDAIVSFDAARIAAKGVAAGTACTCPATGLCRHALAAILFAREDANVSIASDAWDDLAALDPQAIRAFAGAQWWHALDVVADPPRRDGGRVEVALRSRTDPLGTVMFLPGRGPDDVLQGAIVKGPDALSKRLVTAAAIAMHREVYPTRTPEPKPEENRDTVLPAAFLADVTIAIERAASDPSGAAASLEDELRLLAASGRAARAPRLAAALRFAATTMRAARERDVTGSAAAVLASLAEANALATALATRPGNERLMGRLSRDYQVAEPFEAVALGARAWRSATAARGLAITFYDATTDRFVEGGDARAPGQDPAFTPESAYRTAGIGKFSPADAMGKPVMFTEPHLDRSNIEDRLGPRTKGDLLDRPLDLETVESWPIAHRDMRQARHALMRNLPLGLDAGTGRTHAILLPHRMGTPRVDEMAQTVRWSVFDDEGGHIALTLDFSVADDRSLARMVRERFGARVRPVPLLVFARRALDGEEGVIVEPIAALVPAEPPAGGRLARLTRFTRGTASGGGALLPRNFTLDGVPELENELAFAKAPEEVEATRDDPAAAIARAAARVAEDMTRRAAEPDAARNLSRRADALGLTTLALALASLARDPRPAHVLRTVWIARRIAFAA